MSKAGGKAFEERSRGFLFLSRTVTIKGYNQFHQCVFCFLFLRMCTVASFFSPGGRGGGGGFKTPTRKNSHFGKRDLSTLLPNDPISSYFSVLLFLCMPLFILGRHLLFFPHLSRPLPASCITPFPSLPFPSLLLINLPDTQKKSIRST